VGDLGKYAQFQAADAIGNAAKQEGGLAGMGVGVGAGAAIGQAMGHALAGVGLGTSGGGGAASGQGAGASSGTDAVAMINKLHELFKAGVLSQAEFEAKKAELLKKI
jgi:membrane protease subunit (stomatin/prohibitin family)